MPGIAGIVDFKAEPVLLDQKISRMAKALDHTSPSTQEVGVHNNAALAVVRLKNYPYHDLIAQTQNTLLAFWGYLWNSDNLEKTISIDFGNPGQVAVAKLLLKLYQKEGVKGFRHLNGRFVIAVWDNLSEVLHLVTDRHGFCKLFYWLNSQRILFASEFKAIIWHDEFTKKIDEQGLADFMALGFSTGDRTFFQNIKVLPPASVATLKRQEGFSITKYWDFSFHNGDAPVFPEEYYVDKFAEKLVTATKRQIAPGSRICLPLSGGLDSRTLAGILRKTGFEVEVKTLSYGNPDSFDVFYGQKIARKAGFHHTFIPIETTYLKDHAESFVWLTEGTVDCKNAHMLLTYPFIVDNKLDSVMTGFFGDTICGSGSYLKGTDREITDQSLLDIQYNLLAEIMKDEDLRTYIKHDIYQRTRDKTFETIGSYYYSCPSKTKYFRTRYLNICERQRRYSSFNLYVFEFVANVISPFLDYDFVDFILHVPPALMIHRNLYKKMLIEHLPKVASAPYNKTRLPLNVSWARRGLHWRWEQLCHNPLVKATIGKKYIRMNDNYIKAADATSQGSRHLVIKYIKDSLFLADYFNMDRVNEMVDSHLAGKTREHFKITALLTFALWGKLFVENKKPSLGTPLTH